MKHIDSVDYANMKRLNVKGLQALNVGDIVYYQNDDDESGLIIYEAEVKEKHTYNLLLKCTPLSEFVVSTADVLPHNESVSYLDGVENSGVHVFKNIEFK